MIDIQIREGNEADRQYVKDMVVALYAHVASLTPLGDALGPQWEADLRQDVDNRWEDFRFFMATDDGIPVGIARMKHVVLPPWSREKTQIELSELYVLPGYRKHGVGKKLMTSVIEDAHEKGYPEVFLYVHTSNMPAQALYAQCGFEQVDQLWRLRL